MVALVAAIHARVAAANKIVDGRDEPGHDRKGLPQRPPDRSHSSEKVNALLGLSLC
ncbi:hypothetical protein [Rhodoplanes elegans]|uniref:hypothetical protein n=1 Tax=Rhodoplanes elegans TaxID=29408 RepID=UPI0014766AFC|nr:hypothetical protein [Rhodoplanes elegans]